MNDKIKLGIMYFVFLPVFLSIAFASGFYLLFFYDNYGIEGLVLGSSGLMLMFSSMTGMIALFMGVADFPKKRKVS